VAGKRNQPRSARAGQFPVFQPLLVSPVLLVLRVGKKGVEPSRPFGHTDLNRARLPFRHFPGRNLKHCSLGPSSTHPSSEVPPSRALPDPVAWTRIDRDPAGGEPDTTRLVAPSEARRNSNIPSAIGARTGVRGPDTIMSSRNRGGRVSARPQVSERRSERDRHSRKRKGLL
jgi:hypothetical protein